jgi:polysaccharide biosynthesis protein PslG
MPRWSGKALLCLLLALVVVLPASRFDRASAADELRASAVPMEPYYFPETKHYLSGRFRQYWEERGGLFVFGYPLTKVYSEVSTDGKTYPTQYFERARFEYHPENQQPYDVLLTLVGNEVVANRRTEAPFQPAAPSTDTTNVGYAEPTQHNLGFGFRNYWNQYGGLQNFGYPLSEEFREVSLTNGQEYTVQYFERARFEYHPEYQGTPYEVLLGLMGLERMNRVGTPESARAPETSPPAASEIPGYVPVFPLTAQHIEYGFNTFLIGNASGATYNSQTIGKVREAGFGWIRLQLVWKDFERTKGAYDWLPIDTMVTAANSQGVKILLSIVKAPDWASPSRPGALPEDLDAFYNTMREISGRYAGRIQAYEIWNEQNLAGEVGGRVEVAPYFETLKAGFSGVKRNDPYAVVLFGGLTPTGVKDLSIALDDTEYLRQFYAFRGGEGRQYFDALAAHPGSAANPPDSKIPGAPGSGACPQIAVERYGAAPGTCWNGSPDFYFRRIEDQRAVMEQYGDSNKQIWLTEFGWDACQGLPAPRGYEYCALTSEEQQAANIVRAFQIGRDSWPWMGVMIFWNLNYQTIPGIDPADEKYAWGILRPDFTHRPAYDAIKNMPK